jgi:hypothetical protein
MLFVTLGMLVGGIVLIAQGIHILRTRNSEWFFLQRYRHPGLPMGRVKTVSLALIHFGAGIWILAILTGDLARPRSRALLAAKLEGNLSVVLMLLFLAAAGVWALVWPRQLMRWTVREHPEWVQDPRRILVERLIGAILLGMVLFTLAKL